MRLCACLLHPFSKVGKDHHIKNSPMVQMVQIQTLGMDGFFFLSLGAKITRQHHVFCFLFFCFCLAMYQGFFTSKVYTEQDCLYQFLQITDSCNESMAVDPYNHYHSSYDASLCSP